MKHDHIRMSTIPHYVNGILNTVSRQWSREITIDILRKINGMIGIGLVHILGSSVHTQVCVYLAADGTEAAAIASLFFITCYKS